MFGNWLKQKNTKLEILSPLTGESVPLELVPDDAFAGKHMGDGVAIEPSQGVLTAPFDGTVAHLIQTKHALILEHESGLQLLVHIGINTVALKGEGFRAMVGTGDKVWAGQPLIEFDMDFIRAKGFPLITPVVLANGEERSASLEEPVFAQVRAGQSRLLTAELKA
ncbi:PTS sugar transporter subunit IIA [Gorillibacterium sp. sgz5001074]|uniref:PTS sugar transporter subunit IIA n=1 Tax=Gorillibacterium sp. sgz5001074 TaxID=3446695 RepID=UPI003F67D170